jgi:hypothetical protein
MHGARVVPGLGALSNILKQREKCVKAATALIEEGTSVVVGTFFSAPRSVDTTSHVNMYTKSF